MNPPQEVDLILETVHQLSGFDFSQYNRSHIERRLSLRMKIERIHNLTLLRQEIIRNSFVLSKVLNDFSIQVTTMFRDAPFFLEFRKNVIPVLRNFPKIYIWHAGCSTGEEAYSMAILLEEEGMLQQARIYATDISGEAIEKARNGVFPLHRIKDYNRNYLLAGGTADFSKYYDTDERYAYYHPSLSQAISFEQHNLAADGSFNEFHLILCRNVCIYFNEDLKHDVHQLLYGSLHREGFLCLGKQESLVSPQSQSYFKEYNPEHNIYRKNNA